jgi:DNA processing protein
MSMGWGKGHEVLLTLILSGKIKCSKLTALLKRKSLDEICRGGTGGLARQFGLEAADFVQAAAEARGACAALRREGARMIALGEAAYPRLLAEIAGAPPLLFVKGSIEAPAAGAVAIVGSRRPSLAGLALATRLAGDLARSGLAIVSGLARGIDTAAHAGALEAGGKTIGVLACGIDVAYPPENRALAQAISRSGGVVTELVPGSRPLRHNFPRRNRLISGLALGTVVVEAGEKSGALITAAFALEQNRSVFAVPGSPGLARSKGTNRLLKEGARLVESADDVLEDIAPQLGRSPGLFLALGGAADLGAEEKSVLALLSDAPAHVDEVSRSLAIGSHRVLTVLLSLETRGLVRSLPGKFYVLSEGC